jgi:6-phosphofructokinase 1
MPKNYITDDGYGVTQEGIDYLSPLIQGEDYPPYKNGVPVYKKLTKIPVKKKVKESYKL